MTIMRGNNMKAKIWCEITCGNCGAMATISRYYSNAGSIKKIKEETADWIWDDENSMNLCPDCQKKLNK